MTGRLEAERGGGLVEILIAIILVSIERFVCRVLKF